MELLLLNFSLQSSQRQLILTMLVSDQINAITVDIQYPPPKLAEAFHMSDFAHICAVFYH